MGRTAAPHPKAKHEKGLSKRRVLQSLRKPSSALPRGSSTTERVRVTKSAQLILPVSRFAAAMKKQRYARRISPTAAVFLTGVLEYCTTELLKLSAQVAFYSVPIKGKTSGREARHHRIKPRHIVLAANEDDDLGKLLSRVTIAGGGTAGGVHGALENPKKKSSEGADMQKGKQQKQQPAKGGKAGVSGASAGKSGKAGAGVKAVAGASGNMKRQGVSSATAAPKRGANAAGKSR